MSGLKTLKDIEITDRYNLRKEAIKWIKDIEIDIQEFKGLPKNNRNMEDLAGLCATEEWIKLFFNITDGELK